MRKILFLLPILIYISISAFGCSVLGGISSTQEEAPPVGYNEIRCTCIDGYGRYGTFTQYVKGQTEMCKLTTYGTLSNETNISCSNNGVEIRRNYDYVKPPELENGVV